MKQSDIEIYIKDANLSAVTTWLTQILGDCTAWQQKGKVYKCTTLAKHTPITWYEKAVGSWHCLHFVSNDTPWDNDLDCAKAANQFLNVEIRCAPNNWSEQTSESDEQADQWLKIVEQQIIPIVWKT